MLLSLKLLFRLMEVLNASFLLSPVLLLSLLAILDADEIAFSLVFTAAASIYVVVVVVQ